jgi:ABC-type spermidine/putrescine transport system permease subunit I
MIKSIVKIILCCIIAYPICYLLTQLEGFKTNYNWAVILVIDLIVCIGLILYTTLSKKNK